MKKWKMPLALGVVVLAMVYWMRPSVRGPQDAPGLEKRLRSLSRKGVRSDSRCETFFAEWDTLWEKDKALGKTEVRRLAHHLRQYPGVSRETRETWTILASGTADFKEADVSFAYGLSDCQFNRFLLGCRKLFSSVAQVKLKPIEVRDLASGIMGVLRETLEAPVSRPILFGSVQLMRELQTRQWLNWNTQDVAEVDQVLEAFKAFNRSAEAKERALKDKVFAAPSFRDIAQEDREEIAQELFRSYAETEKLRVRFLPLLSRVRLPSS